jgi:hypothetical protein
LLAHTHTRVPPRILLQALLSAGGDDVLGADERKILRAVIAMVEPWIMPAPDS